MLHCKDRLIMSMGASH